MQAPAGAETTPLPRTCRVKVTVSPGGALLLKVAETALAVVIVTVQVVALPEHEPPQLSNVAPAAGFAVNVTLDPVATFALHVAPALQSSDTVHRAKPAVATSR